MKYIFLLFMPGLFWPIEKSLDTHKKDCLSYIASYITKMEKFEQPYDDQKYYFMDMEYEVSTNPVSGAKKDPYKTEVKVIVSKKFYFYESDAIEIYSNENETIQIIHPVKQIFRATISNQSAMHEQNKKQLSAFQKKMLENAEVINCKEGPNRTFWANIRINPEVSNSLNIDHVIYHYSIADETMKDVQIFYNSKSIVSKMKISYSKIDFDYKFNKLKNIEQYIFTNKKLKPRFAGYKVIDNRLKSKQ